MTDPDLLVPLKQTGQNERHSSDLREPQSSTSDSQPASSQLDSVTTTSESSMSLPSSPSGSSQHREHQYKWHRVKELAKFFTPTSDEETNNRVNTRTR